MGAWGPAIFSDDTAVDVRDDYRDYVGRGLTGPEATDKLMVEYTDTLADSDERSVFWLALAATQWRCGRLEPRVLKHALAIIASGESLDRWRESGGKVVNQREAALEKLRLQLLSDQPREKRIPKPFVATCDWATCA